MFLVQREENEGKRKMKELGVLIFEVRQIEYDLVNRIYLPFLHTNYAL